ncbi:MAG: hypothetical protein H6744_17195 [Deltaproteobacteria bacterium]|nr:hypothetical protein [Deltaproteobacteria bacterium]MCB9788420.1 hypothetical protein [Deltaproteobacteria bacterium]
MPPLSNRRPVRAAETLHEGEGWVVRRATPEDGPALAALLAEVPFGGSSPIVETRAPDVFALRQHRTMEPDQAPDFYVVDHGGVIGGAASIVVRPGATAAGVVPLAHLGDLRLRPELRGGAVLPSLLRTALEDVRVRQGAELAVTTVVDHDHTALAPFIRRTRERFEQPMAQVASLVDLLLVPLGAVPATSLRFFGPAAHQDLPELGAFISARQATRRLAEPVSIESLARELGRIPGQRVDHTFMLRDGTGALAGCLTVVDTGRFRRFVPQRTTGLARVRSLGRRALGLGSQLPDDGEPAEVLWVSTLEARGDDYARMQSLIEAVAGVHADSPWDWLGLALPRGPQTKALARQLGAAVVPLSVVVLSLAGTRWNNVDFRAPRVRVNAAFL